MVGSCFNSARFLLSAAKYEQLPEDIGTEIVFAGYSNVGKSSTLNALTGNKQLARVSKTPGRTQCLNVFTLKEQQRLIDLPGFGYAKVPKSMQDEWRKTIDQYFRERKSLIGVVLIMDIRHLLRPFEIEMIAWAAQSGLGLHLVLNKADKLKKQEIKQAIESVTAFLQEHAYTASLQTLSTLKQAGIEDLIATVTEWLTERSSYV
jgi:GTP-binding protein